MASRLQLHSDKKRTVSPNVLGYSHYRQPLQLHPGQQRPHPQGSRYDQRWHSSYNNYHMNADYSGYGDHHPQQQQYSHADHRAGYRADHRAHSPFNRDGHKKVHFSSQKSLYNEQRSNVKQNRKYSSCSKIDNAEGEDLPRSDPNICTNVSDTNSLIVENIPLPSSEVDSAVPSVSKDLSSFSETSDRIVDNDNFEKITFEDSNEPVSYVNNELGLGRTVEVEEPSKIQIIQNIVETNPEVESSCNAESCENLIIDSTFNGALDSCENAETCENSEIEACVEVETSEPALISYEKNVETHETNEPETCVDVETSEPALMSCVETSETEQPHHNENATFSIAESRETSTLELLIEEEDDDSFAIELDPETVQALNCESYENISDTSSLVVEGEEARDTSLNSDNEVEEQSSEVDIGPPVLIKAEEWDWEVDSTVTECIKAEMPNIHDTDPPVLNLPEVPEKEATMEIIHETEPVVVEEDITKEIESMENKMANITIVSKIEEGESSDCITPMKRERKKALLDATNILPSSTIKYALREVRKNDESEILVTPVRRSLRISSVTPQSRQKNICVENLEELSVDIKQKMKFIPNPSINN